MKTESDGSPPKKVAEIAGAANKAIAELLQASAVAAGKAGAAAEGRDGETDRFSATYAIAVGCVSALHVLASMLGHHGDASRARVTNEDIGKLVNPTSTLLAALLAHIMCPSAVAGETTERGTMIEQNIEFGNGVLLDAIQQAERFTGRPVDGWVNPGILAAVREAAEDANEPMNKFLAQRRPTPGNLH